MPRPQPTAAVVIMLAWSTSAAMVAISVSAHKGSPPETSPPLAPLSYATGLKYRSSRHLNVLYVSAGEKTKRGNGSRNYIN